MNFLRLLGWALFLVGVAVAGYEVISGLIGPKYHIVSMGELWFKLNVASLNGLQVVVQRHLGVPWLWDNVVVQILRLPAWTVFVVPGLLLMAIPKRRRRRSNR